MDWPDALAGGALAEWLSRATYVELLGWEESGKQDRREVIADDGKLYQVVSYVLPDGDGRLRLVAASGWPGVRVCGGGSALG